MAARAQIHAWRGAAARKGTLIFMDRKEILISLTQALIRSRSYSGEEGGVVDTADGVFQTEPF